MRAIAVIVACSVVRGHGRRPRTDVRRPHSTADHAQGDTQELRRTLAYLLAHNPSFGFTSAVSPSIFARAGVARSGWPRAQTGGMDQGTRKRLLAKAEKEEKRAQDSQGIKEGKGFAEKSQTVATEELMEEWLEPIPAPKAAASIFKPVRKDPSKEEAKNFIRKPGGPVKSGTGFGKSNRKTQSQEAKGKAKLLAMQAGESEEWGMTKSLAAWQEYRYQNSEDEMRMRTPGEAVMPENVSQRIIDRIIKCVSVPLVLTVLLWASFFLLTQTLNLDVGPSAVAFVTLGGLLSTFGGVTYGVLSASWDEDRDEPRGFLGRDEVPRNLLIMSKKFLEVEKLDRLWEAEQKSFWGTEEETEMELKNLFGLK